MDKLKMSKEGKGAAATRKKQSEVPDAALLTKYQESLARFRQQKRQKGDQDNASHARLKSFTAKLKEQRKVAKENGSSARPVVNEHSAADTAVPGYDGQVNNAIDHRSYMPTAWRVRGRIVLVRTLCRPFTCHVQCHA